MSKNLLIKTHLQALKRIPNVAYSRGGFLRLDKNENLIAFPEKLIREVKKGITADFISSYPELFKLYELIGEWVGCKKENIYISAGSDAAIKSVFEVFLAPGDKILVLHPTYAMYYVYAYMFGGILLKVEYSRGLSLSAEEILRRIKEKRPRLICIANPNSPTGTVICPEALEEIIKTADKYSSVILIDEAYYLYYQDSVAGLINRYRNLVVTRTFSKAFGLASARLGFALGHKTMIENLKKSRPMYETNAFAFLSGRIVLDNFSVIRSNVKKTMEGKAYLEKELDRMAIKYFKSFANFLVIDVGSYKKSCEIVKRMKEAAILIGGGYKHSCLRNCIRVTAGPKSDMKVFLKEFERLHRHKLI